METLELIELIRKETGMHYMSYGGRGSFGEKWPAFMCDSVQDFAAEALSAMEGVEDDNLREALCELQDLLNTAITDSMGRSSIVVYWQIPLEEGHPLFQSDEEEGDLLDYSY